MHTIPVQRWFVEDGRDLLEAARTKDVALVTYGDPLIATTYSELRSRATKNSIKTAILHSASGIASIIGESGLHVYKFGRMVTMTSELHSAVTVYNTIFQNLLAGSHTLILTEYNHNDESKEPFFLDPSSVFKMLLDAERAHKQEVFSDDTFAVVASRVGMQDQKITSGKVKSLMKLEFGIGPHSINRIEAQMVERYAPKAKQAVQDVRKLISDGTGDNKGIFEVLENAECYIADSKQFLRQGKFELAVLSIGYAEGLIDALRYQKRINPWNTST
jgi:diphthine synthase